MQEQIEIKGITFKKITLAGISLIKSIGNELFKEDDEIGNTLLYLFVCSTPAHVAYKHIRENTIMEEVLKLGDKLSQEDAQELFKWMSADFESIEDAEIDIVSDDVAKKT